MEGPTMHWILAGGDKQRAKHRLIWDVLFIQRRFPLIAFTCWGERPLTFQLLIVCLNARHDISGPFVHLLCGQNACGDSGLIVEGRLGFNATMQQTDPVWSQGKDKRRRRQ